jgi:PadR family transcriptional regulator, regulatory protein PadR
MQSEMLKGHLDGMVLAVLDAAPTYGYAIVEALRERSDGVFDVPEGSIYPALHRLERAGAVSSKRDRVNGRERRVYELSPQGRASLRSRRTEWAAFATAVGSVLGVSGA